MPDMTTKSFRMGTYTEYDSQIAYIKPEFEIKVLSHILGNYMQNSPYPLYLAIHGKKGEGKTFQTLRICSKYNIVIYYISGSELCGSYEKDSIKTIENNYNEALENYREKKEVSVFIIDDFHLSIASTEAGIGRTVNSQILIGYLMNMADKAKAAKEYRIPIILLANDFQHMYGPLIRDGRMDFYEWNPDLNDKIDVVLSHYDDILSESQKDDLKQLVEMYKDQPISFFTEVKNDLQKDQVEKYIENHKSPFVAEMLTGLQQCTLPGCDISKIKEIAKKRDNSHPDALHERREGLHGND